MQKVKFFLTNVTKYFCIRKEKVMMLIRKYFYIKPEEVRQRL